MGTVVQNITAWIMSAIVFLAAVHCSCAGSARLAAAGDHDPETGGKSCCKHQEGRLPDESDGSHEHQPGCRHCESPALNDVVSVGVAQSMQAEWQQTSLSGAFGLVSTAFSTRLRSIVFRFHNLPPSLTSPTLLRQHCALTI